MDPRPRSPVQTAARLHVGLDALAFGPRPAGVGRYVTTLLEGLASLAGAPRVTVFARAESRGSLTPLAPALAGPGPLLSRAPARLLWEQALLPSAARRLGLDLLHGLMGVVPLRSRVPRVVTVHDATFFTHPELHARAKVVWFRAILPLSAHAARLVVTDSEASRAAIVRALGVAAERVRVVPLAVDPSFRPASAEEQAEALRAHGLDGPFVLYAGVLEPRKNLPRLVEAVARLRAAGLPHRLVLAGKPGWGLAPLEAALARADHVVRLGWVPDARLRALLTACDAFAYVPLVEGFGLPVAEALACGAPVVTSDRSSLPEVAGGAAVLVDPEDPEAIARGLRSVVDDRAARAGLIRAGLARAAELTPERLARGTVQVWEEAVS